MKKYITICLLTIYLAGQGWAQENALTIGDRIPDLVIKNLRDETNDLNRDNWSGKVLILDFWATWCGPCITALNHLQELKQEFPEALTIVSISGEAKERLQRFLSKRDYGFYFGWDPDQKLWSYFPHRIIPHSILVNPKGEIIAITEPGNIQKEVIRKVLQGESISLEKKEDNVGFDFQADYFQKDSLTLQSFDIQRSIPGVPCFSKMPNKGPFQERRVSLHNFTIDGMYRMAFQKSSYRMEYEVDVSQFDYEVEENKYCLDLIVAPEDKGQFFEIFQQKLLNSFEVKGRLEKRKIEVAQIFVPEGAQITLKKSNHRKEPSARGDGYLTEGASLRDFAQYLEDFGIVGRAVVDETNVQGLFEFNFSFEPGDKDTFLAALKEMGLGMKRVEREVEVLVIYEETKP